MKTVVRVMLPDQRYKVHSGEFFFSRGQTICPTVSFSNSFYCFPKWSWFSLDFPRVPSIPEFYWAFFVFFPQIFEREQKNDVEGEEERGRTRVNN